MATVEQIREALNSVTDPVAKSTLGDSGAVVALAIDETGLVRIKLRVTSPSESLRRLLHEAVEARLTTLGVGTFELEFDVKVTNRATTSTDPIPGVRNVVLVMSGKGGVGKSTVSSNLALALRRLGTRVGLLDADIYGPSVPTMLGIEGTPVTKDGAKIQTLQRFGIKLMSVGFLLEDHKQAVIWRGPMLHGALQQFVADVDWGDLDYLIVDLPPGTGDVALTIAQKLPITGAVVVTTPQSVALEDVYKSVSMCKKMNIPILGVVENMSWFIDPTGVKHTLFGEGGGQLIADYAEAPLFGQIPLDPAAREWADKGTPVVQADPGSSGAIALAKIAEAVVERIATLHNSRGNDDTSDRKRLRILT